MKKQLLLGLLLSAIPYACHAADPTEDQLADLLDQLVIVKINIDTWLDLSQIEPLYKQAQNIFGTINNLKTTAPQGSAGFKLLVEYKNNASKVMNMILSIYRRRAPKATPIKTTAPVAKAPAPVR